MQITGRLKYIGATQEVSASFKKREVVVSTNEQYVQHILIEFNQEKCDVLNSYNVGDEVEVSINIKGKEWTNPQGETKYFNSIQGWKINKVGSQQQAPQSNEPAGIGADEDDFAF